MQDPSSGEHGIPVYACSATVKLSGIFLFRENCTVLVHFFETVLLEFSRKLVKKF